MFSTLFSIPDICHQLGVTRAIIAPGSRNAPLTLAFARHQSIVCEVIPDERSAAFVALGIAQQLNKPVVLICTSGSASLNFAPAVAEAFFAQIPLLVFTADRPPEWIDQLDGQTIRQSKIYGEHVKRSLDAPVDVSHKDASWHLQRQVSEAINLSTQSPKGPVHINFPFREPLYPEGEVRAAPYKVIQKTTPESTLSDEVKKLLIDSWNSFERKLIVCGQGFYSDSTLNLLSQLNNDFNIPVVGDIIANIHPIEGAILRSDVFLGSDKAGLHESLKPDLLITIGQSVLSKNLKLLLRKHRPTEHWHISVEPMAADTYQSLTKHIQVKPETLLETLTETDPNEDFTSQKQENYYHIWQIEERKSQRLIPDFFDKTELGEFKLVREILRNLPKCNLHLANSMAVRYANFIGLQPNQEVTVYCNRGTSGIDGSTSTAVGHALDSKELNILITGDLAFFYDRNAFWNNLDISNLHIVLLNNHGGGIFRMIKGPASTPELEQYFETTQELTAKSLAQEYGYDYMLIDKPSKLKNYVSQFFDREKKTKILELVSDSQQNKDILSEFKSAFNLLK